MFLNSFISSSKSLLVYGSWNGSMSWLHRCKNRKEFLQLRNILLRLTRLPPCCTFISMDEVQLNHGMSRNVCFHCPRLQQHHSLLQKASFSSTVLRNRPDSAGYLLRFHSSQCSYVQFVHFYDRPIIKYTYISLKTVQMGYN